MTAPPVRPHRRLVLCTLASAGCTLQADRDHDGGDAPRAAPLARPVRTAWVFGSGGPRGFVHVGVLEALAELGLRPDLVVGSSVGAAVGCLYAAGLSPARIRALAMALRPTRFVELALGSDERFSGGPIAATMREHLPVQRLEAMPIAMAVVVWQPSRNQPVAFTAGDAPIAVQASAAIEGQIAPVRIRGETYVDADLHVPLPVRVARALGARRVLAVDASAHEDRAPPGAERFRDSDRRKRLATQPDAARADRVLHPDFGYWVSFSEAFRLRAIEAGRRDTLEQADALRALHRD